MYIKKVILEVIDIKMFSDCSNLCCICALGKFCLAGHGDDDFILASKEQIIDNLNSGRYSTYRGYMIRVLQEKYNYEYEKNHN